MTESPTRKIELLAVLTVAELMRACDADVHKSLH